MKQDFWSQNYLFDKKINVLQNRVTKLENVIKELTQHRENI